MHFSFGEGALISCFSNFRSRFYILLLHKNKQCPILDKSNARAVPKCPVLETSILDITDPGEVVRSNVRNRSNAFMNSSPTKRDSFGSQLTLKSMFT